ncbi:hypothetical protein CYY_009094 [Polysphondylium violaceum]|uniref:Transmembrane protein n=1 Tax=Polysphondylium violaceum TaxID=133409 RepID=A0A8J4PMK0_9MYCE|nr:hypothetical protein CYY_009094 [Polysphondylium violaceum]
MKYLGLIPALFWLMLILTSEVSCSSTTTLSNQLINLLQPKNYLSNSKWRLPRDRPLNIGWETQNHKDTIHSVVTSNSLEYIVSCSNDNVAKFHRVLMYPNLYPDWTHLYYGSLELRGYGDSNYKSLGCLMVPDTKQLITMTKSKESNLIYIDTYSMIELENIENRHPIIGKYKDRNYPSINDISDKTKFKIVFELDDYNEIWVNSSNVEYFSKLYKSNMKKNIQSSQLFKSFTLIDFNQDQDYKMTLSNDGSFLAIQSNEKVFIYSRDSIEPVEIVLNQGIKDLLFVNQKTLLILDQQGNLIFYQYEKEQDWQYLSTSIPPLSKILSISGNGASQTRCDTTLNDNESPILVSLLDNLYTVHIIQLDLISTLPKVGIKIIVSLPYPNTDGDYNPITTQQQQQKDLKVIMKFSLDSYMFLIEYPQSNILYIYNQVVDNDRIDYLLHGVIQDFKNRLESSLLFNMKYYYIVGGMKGHLLFLREIKSSVPLCDPYQRIKSFYLPPPPLYSNITGEQKDSYIMERDGVFESPYTFLVLSVYVISVLLLSKIYNFETLLLSFILNFTKSKLKLNLNSKKLHSILFYLIATIIFGVSIFEILYQSSFTNDWPAHIHHIEQWINPSRSNPIDLAFTSDGNWNLLGKIQKLFDFDYINFMHYHGPCTYPAGFMYFYYILYKITLLGSLQIFQFLWAIFEFINFLLIKKICDQLNLPILLSILPVISNRLHLYNVRVVLHTIFFSPAILFIFFNELSFTNVILNLFIMGLVQLFIGLPFLLSSPVSYLTIAYDFSRTLLWEKTRNFKFVGRVQYESSTLNLSLLIVLIMSILIFCYKFQTVVNAVKSLITKTKSPKLISSYRLILLKIYVLVFLFINFLAVVFARGLYSPFLCWYFYTFPIILYFADFPFTYIIIYWVAHEVLFRFFKDLLTEMIGTYIYFIINLSILVRMFHLKLFKPLLENGNVEGMNRSILDEKDKIN